MRSTIGVGCCHASSAYLAVESELGKGKIGSLLSIETPKKNKKPSSTHETKFTNESESRTKADVRSTDCCVHACMHMLSCSACSV